MVRQGQDLALSLVFGVHAMSKDQELFDGMARTIADQQETIERVREAINQVIHYNGNMAGYVNKEENLRCLYAIKMAQYILKALDGEQE